MYKEISWDRDDLLACANACRMINENYGREAVEEVCFFWGFGSLDVDACLGE